jgi:uncharacterized protein
MNHEPLSDRDYQRLAASLARFKDQQCMSLEHLDGFFTALLCGPMPLKPADCLPMIMGDAFDDETSFPTTQSLDRFAELLLRHWVDIANTLREGRAFHPWLQEDESGAVHGNEWALGFVDGMQLLHDDWTLLFDDAQHAPLLEAIMALAFEHHPDEDMRPYLDDASPEQRQAWLAEISPSVSAIYAFFAALRLELTQEEEEPPLKG